MSHIAHSSVWNYTQACKRKRASAPIGARARAHTHTHTHQRLIGPVGTVLVTAAPHVTLAGVGPNVGAVRGRNGRGLRNILSFSFRFTPEIKGWIEGVRNKEMHRKQERLFKAGGFAEKP